MSVEGFYLYNNKYYYCSSTNTLINSDLKDIYSKYRKNQEIHVDAVKVDADSVKSNLVSLKQLTFEITQSCNLNCAYCVYESGNYVHFRSGSTKSLEFETAKRSIDQIWQLIKERDKKEFTIGFYGGEPLIYFPVIKKIADYSTKTFYKWKLSFSITTNSTLLTDEIINYFIEKDFFILISLDGPKENHDAKRVYRNGKGSYSSAIESLGKIRRINNEYYSEKVSFSIVYSKDLSFKKMFHFFNNEPLVKNNNLKLAFVTETDSTYYEKNPFEATKFKKDFGEIFQAILRKKKERKGLSSLESDIATTFDIFSKQLGKSHFNSLMGTCFYSTRLYVDADGGFHICEKMNDSFQFGSVDKGFDFQKMAALTNGYQEVLKKCHQCEVKYLCQKCYVNFAKGGNVEISKEFCTNAKYNIKKMFEDVIRFEEGETAE